MNVAVSWSGGKDCCLALHIAQEQGLLPVVLVCIMNDQIDYSRSNGVSQQILDLQAQSLNLPIHYIKTNWQDYESNLLNALQNLKNEYNLQGCVFGDIDIISHREFEEQICQESGINAYLPLWNMPREQIIQQNISRGIKSLVSVVNKSRPIHHILGQEYNTLDFDILRTNNIDICGEFGEFHTVVYDAPLFRHKFGLQPTVIHDLSHVLLNEFKIIYL